MAIMATIGTVALIGFSVAMYRKWRVNYLDDGIDAVRKRDIFDREPVDIPHVAIGDYKVKNVFPNRRVELRHSGGTSTRISANCFTFPT